MKVKELIELLQNEDSEMEVITNDAYGGRVDARYRKVRCLDDEYFSHYFVKLDVHGEKTKEVIYIG